MIKSELLYYLQSIQKYESVTQAAEHLHMTQPALSIAIKRLENELGIVLLEKDKSKAKLSPDALTILENGKPALNALNDIELFITSKNLPDFNLKDFTICYNSNLSYNILPKNMQNLQKAFGTNFNIYYKTFDETVKIIDYVQTHENCIAIISTIYTEVFDHMPNYSLLSRGAYYLKMNAHSKFFTNMPHSIYIKDIKNAPIVFLSSEFFNILISYIKENNHNSSPTIISAENLQMVNACISADAGITTALYFSKQHDSNYKYLKIADFPTISLCTFTSPNFPSELHESIIDKFFLM